MLTVQAAACREPITTLCSGERQPTLDLHEDWVHSVAWNAARKVAIDKNGEDG